MHHEGVVEALVRTVAGLALDVGVLLVNLRSLREARLLLVHGLRDENARIFGAEVKKQRRAVLHHRNELFVAHPRRVKEDVVAKVADAVDDLAGVVDRAVVRAELNHGEAEGALGAGLFRTDFSNELAQIRFVEAMLVNAADEAPGIAGRFKIDGRRARLLQRAVMVRLVIVAVKEHQVARREERIEHNLVRSGSAVQHKVRLVGVVDARRLLLRGAGRAFVNEEVAHGDVRIAKVCAKDAFAEKFRKFAPGRMTAEEGAALVPRAVELRMALRNIVFQAAEEGRQHRVFVLLRERVDLAAVELRIVGLEVDDARGAADQARIDFAVVVENDDRNAERRLFDFVEQPLKRLRRRHDDGRHLREVGRSEVNDFAFAGKGITRFRRGGDEKLAHELAPSFLIRLC